MTAPEREALRNELRDCTAALSDIISCNNERGDDAVPTWVATMLRGVRATIRDALQALSEAPAVTVTEGMIEELRILSGSASSAEWHQNYAVSKKLWREFDAKLDAIKAALKSTTPQTGSQE